MSRYLHDESALRSPDWLEPYGPVLRVRAERRLKRRLAEAKQRHAQAAKLYPHDIECILNEAIEFADDNDNPSLADDLRRLKGDL